MEMDKHYEHSAFEKQARELWEENKIYQFDKTSKKETFSIDTPPPTVSGSLHTGHVFSYAHTDIIARFKRMQGFNIFYPMGFDDNGLATERFVEKTHKIKAHNLKRSEFIKLCLQETEKVEKEFENLWKSLGFSMDWTKVYSTISNRVRKISQYSFIDLYNKNFIYRKSEPSLYCTTCRTAVAQAELDDKEITTTFNDIEFQTQDGEKLIISTTRPELLPACVAIFYNPEDTRYAHLKDKNAVVPIFNKQVKILADEKVDPEKGSGLVMCCTFGDQTDIHWFKKHKLEFIQAVGNNGKWTNVTGPLEGLNAIEARKKILELLKDSKQLLSQKQITHSVNVHERCKQEIEYLILPQWFIKILENKQIFLDLADKIDWKPAFMKSRYKDWVSNLSWDWCISRQRFFGIPFPVWHCQDCNQIILADEKDLPIDPQEILYPGKHCPNCSGTNIKPDTDVMDTWNTSALTPQINTNWPENNTSISMPMSMRPQAHDIIRTWAFDTIVKAHYHSNMIPWKEIVISGHVLAGKEKVSKSKEGSIKVPGPLDLLKNYPADVIRYWAANGKLGTDTAFSENQLKIGQRLITKLWNAFRFCKEHIEQFKFNNNIDNRDIENNLDNLNKWLLDNFSNTVKTYHSYFEQYDYTLALETAEKFFWHIFCDNYLELIKDQIFNPDKYSEQILQNTRFTLYTVGLGILKLFAPILPHITETIYQQLYKDKEKAVSLHIITFNKNLYNYSFEKEANLINKVIELIILCRKVKTENKLSLKAEIENLNIYSEKNEILEQLKQEETLILGITKAKNLNFLNKKLQDNNLEKIGEILNMSLSI
ncbi:valine--tRNA ligase [Candidatus Babeliales bacterium]|nr:valine--tRNA ligase [Candidatus Babeliales bacterium]